MRTITDHYAADHTRWPGRWQPLARRIMALFIMNLPLMTKLSFCTQARLGARLEAGSMKRLIPQVTGWALLGAAVAGVPGCVSTAESPSQVRKAAGQVSLMISSRMGAAGLPKRA